MGRGRLVVAPYRILLLAGLCLCDTPVDRLRAEEAAIAAAAAAAAEAAAAEAAALAQAELAKENLLDNGNNGTNGGEFFNSVLNEKTSILETMAARIKLTEFVPDSSAIDVTTQFAKEWISVLSDVSNSITAESADDVFEDSDVAGDFCYKLSNLVISLRVMYVTRFSDYKKKLHERPTISDLESIPHEVMAIAWANVRKAAVTNAHRRNEGQAKVKEIEDALSIPWTVGLEKQEERNDKVSALATKKSFHAKYIPSWISSSFPYYEDYANRVVEILQILQCDGNTLAIFDSFTVLGSDVSGEKARNAGLRRTQFNVQLQQYFDDIEVVDRRLVVEIFVSILRDYTDKEVGTLIYTLNALDRSNSQSEDEDDDDEEEVEEEGGDGEEDEAEGDDGDDRDVHQGAADEEDGESWFDDEANTTRTGSSSDESKKEGNQLVVTEAVVTAAGSAPRDADADGTATSTSTSR